MPVVEAITNRDYGIGNPLEMVMPDPSKVGSEGLKVLQKGMRSDYTPLSPFKEATLEEGIKNSFMFFQVSAVKGGSLTGNTAELSFGLPWDRQSPMESCAEAIARKIGGNLQIHRFGPHKLLLFLEADVSPEEMLRMAVEAPREPYEQELPHLSRAVNQMQNIRAIELLYSDGNGQAFIDIFNGDKDPLVRAYQDNQRYSFVWGCENRNGRLWGMNLENKPQPISELAIDEDTRLMILAKETFLNGAGDINRYVFQMDYSATVSCCNIAFNAQQSGLIATDLSSFMNKESFSQNISPVPYLPIYPKNNCQKCRKNKDDGCSCEKENKPLAA